MITDDAFKVIEQLPFIGVAITSPETARWVRVNATLCRMLGYAPGELVDKSWQDVTHPDDLPPSREAFQRIQRGESDGFQLDKRYLHRDGRVVHVSANVRAVRGSDGTVRYFMSALTDITARLEAETAARRAAALLENLSHQVPGVIYQFLLRPDGSSCFPFASEALWEVYEVAPGDVVDDAGPVFSRLHPDDLDRIAASIRASADTLAPWGEEYRVVLPSRGVRWVRGDARPERLADGSVMWHGYIADVTERHEAMDALVRLQAAIESSLTGVAIAGLDGILTYVNPAFLRIWGYDDVGQVVGRHASMFWMEPTEAEAVITALGTVGTWSGELVATCHDGRQAILELNASRFANAAGIPIGMLASFVDVTETRRLQTELLQSRKMESIGRLAGGIAHDFNNLLTVIQASLDLAASSIGPADPIREELGLIGEAADLAASLTRQLLAFSRRQVIAPVVLDVNTLVHRVAGMLQRLLGERVVLRLHTTETAARVRFDPGQAEQILVNLALNARDAMADGGTLTIETSVVHLDGDASRRGSGTPAGDYVLLAVSDTGSGMSPETLEHAFEPFYTTKRVGHGTGLGLAMIHGAVSQNGGRVQVYSEVGHGTTFRIYLPLVLEEATVEPAASPAGLPRGDESIVVVEDDDTVRGLLVRLLERQGYRVEAFPRGEAMLAWLADTTAPVHLLVTDVIMPGLNGRELADRVHALRPDVRVLYASGYTANVIVDHGVLKPDIEFLAKPFTAADLATKVRALLDA